MPVYEYYCPANACSVEVVHSITERIATWGELCARGKAQLGDTPADSPVERLLFAPGVSTPAGDSRLKELGFTKLVKRDTGVYENVTASGAESRYMNAGDASTLPQLSKKIRD
ncbi:MAG: zinc ribbon domain-containing protein [Candidatus Sumerlaeaceae bacterium]